MPTDPYKSEQEKRKRDKAAALKQLTIWKKQKLALKRHAFFVPGWRDEECVCWSKFYKKNYTPIKAWFQDILSNPELAHEIEFSIDESKSCKSFLDFAEIVKERVWTTIGKKTDFDIVGHSMGGLDIVGAVTSAKNPLRNVKRCLTVATPHQGSELGEIGPIFKKLLPFHKEQCLNLDPDRTAIKKVNDLSVRKTFLDRIEKLYCFEGTRDQAVMRSARFNPKGIDAKLYEQKVETIEIGGARHSDDLGITQDVRVISTIISILSGLYVTPPKGNQGNFKGGMQSFK